MRKKILICGGTGLVGNRLIELMDFDRYEVYILTRTKKAPTENIQYFEWDFSNMEIEKGATNVDYIINLTGAGIADKRWTAERKKILIDSRVNSLKLIKKGIDQDGSMPDALVSASAVGYYGDREGKELRETSSPGKGFMSECCELWEKAALEIESYFDRLSIARIGIVLSTKGGALPKILMTKSIGVYNYFGNGDQYYSWVHIDDLCKMLIVMTENQTMSGIYNCVSPQPLTNKDFTIKIKDALGGMITLPAPKFGLRLALGEMADVVLNSNNVIPQRFLEANYDYKYSEIGPAVKALVQQKN